MIRLEYFSAWLSGKARTERGASLVEYALLLALIAIVCIAAVTTLGQTAADNFDGINSALENNQQQ